MTDSFSENLRRIRNEKGMSQQQLAEKIYVDRSSIARWENGMRIPDLTLISRLSRCLGVEVSDLLPDTTSVNETPVVILVDDEKTILTGMLRTLSETLPGAEIMGFTKPSEALEFARRNQVSIAFLDIEMGRVNGLDLCERLMEINSRTNVVYLTAWPDYSLRAWKTGASGFLIKPPEKEEILAILPNLRHPVGGLLESGRAKQ